MTKRLKFLIIILVLLLLAGSAYLYIYEKKQAQKSKTACSMVLSRECNEYLFKITKQKKYEQAVQIQSRRIKENEKLLDVNRAKIKNKKWLSMKAQEGKKEFEQMSAELRKNNNGKQKFNKDGSPYFADFEKDYSRIMDNNFILRDFVLDTMVVAAIQRKELKDFNAAKSTLEHGLKVLEGNKYAAEYNKYKEMLERNIEKNNKLLKK